jgi:hypothetical protein
MAAEGNCEGEKAKDGGIMFHPFCTFGSPKFPMCTDPSRTEHVNFSHIVLTKPLLNLTPSSQAHKAIIKIHLHKTPSS